MTEHARAVVSPSQRADDRAFLWALCYRMTGSAADADDLVQDTLVRALERPPTRADEPMRPWLVRVAMNLSRDLLRKRKRRRYEGPWLPAPIETPEGEPPALEIAGEGGTEGRYDLFESVSFAFLLALEVLTPRQRAVLVLRDVLDYSVRETADALDMSEGAVKTTHHRARARMSDYDARSRPPRAEVAPATRAALERLVTGLVLDDVAALEGVLSESVRVLSDGGGEFHAARQPVVGKGLVIKFLRNLTRRRGDGGRSEVRVLNGVAALVSTLQDSRGEAPRVVTRCDVGADGRITEIHAVLATPKLTGVRFDGE